MTVSPRIPLEGKLPLFCALRAFKHKGWRACAPRSVDCVEYFAKSLIMENSYPMGCYVFSTRCALYSTCCPFSSTCPAFRFFTPISIYLSLLKKKERKKEGLRTKNAIHAFEQLIKKASTGFHPLPPLTRGNTWMMLFISVNMLRDKLGPSTHPRVVLPVGTFEEPKLESPCWN